MTEEQRHYERMRYALEKQLEAIGDTKISRRVEVYYNNETEALERAVSSAYHNASAKIYQFRDLLDLADLLPSDPANTAEGEG